jgi:hypothetical protein
MRTTLAIVGSLLLATSALAERVTELNGRKVQLFPSHERAAKIGGARASNLSYHNGPVIHQAKVVSIFWGPAATWGANGSPSALAQSLTSFFAQFGGNPEYNVITQYYDSRGSVQLTNLTSAYWVDNTTPPTSVSDAAVQGEVIKALASVGVDTDAVYEVFLPPASYASYGSFDSCGGPNLQFCAYHSNFQYNGRDIKYASMPYPSCSGCQWPGWTATQNFEHFACHETREAVTDPDGNAWYDRQGSEADDKCAWSPSLFLVNGYGYQDEWSNLNGGCVPSR